MQQIISSFIRFPESSVLLTEDPINNIEGFSFLIDSTDTMRRYSTYHCDAISRLFGGVIKRKMMRMDDVKRFMPCSVVVRYDNYSGLLLCVDVDHIYVIDFNDVREPSNDERIVSDGYMFFRLTIDGLQHYIDRLCRNDCSVVEELFLHTLEDSHFHLDYVPLVKQLDYNEEHVRRLLYDYISARFCEILNYILIHPYSLEASLTCCGSYVDLTAIDNVKFRQAIIQQLGTDSLPVNFHKDRNIMKQFLHVAKTVTKADVESMINSMLTCEHYEIITYK